MPQPVMHAEDRALVDAHRALLDRALSFLRALSVEPQTPGDVVVLGLVARVLQLAHAVQSLCEEGHAGEAPPVARAILNGTASLVAICDKDREGRAFAYVHGGRLSKRRIEGAARELGLSGEDRKRFIQQLNEASTDGERAFVKAGTYMLRLGNERKDTWHGLTDEKLFSQMGLAPWYELVYRTFSDESHVSARAVTLEIREVLNHDITFGAKFGPAWEVLLPSGRCVAETLAQLNLAFKLDRRPEVLAISKPYEEAIGNYRHYDRVT